MKFSVETWAPEYGIAADLESLEVSGESVDATAERRLADWAPITPTLAELPTRVAFVDGVRRIDARLWIHDADRSHPAVCASVAAGVVRCTPARAEIESVLVEHLLITSARSNASTLVTRHATFVFTPTPSDEPEDVYLAIHQRMTALERSLGDHGCDLVVFDGPLRGRDHLSGVGFVKTQRVQYLPEELVPILGRLGDGDRTPMLLLGARPGFARWTWYLRLPGRRAHPLSGIVRCELPANGPCADVIDRVDQVSALLPRYASEPHKEPRAPQNLYPIGGLESALRRRLGDQLLLERSLRVAANV